MSKMEFLDPVVAEKYQILYQILLGSFFLNTLYANWRLSRPSIFSVPQCEAIDRIGVPNSEAIDVFGVPQCEAIDAENVPSLAQTFELQKHFSGCFKSWMNFSTLVQYSGGLNASYIKKFY